MFKVAIEFGANETIFEVTLIEFILKNFVPFRSFGLIIKFMMFKVAIWCNLFNEKLWEI